MEKDNSIVIRGKFIRRLNNRYNSDFCINLVKVTGGISQLPSSLVKGKNSVEMILTGTLLPTIPIEAEYVCELQNTKQYGVQGRVNSFHLIAPDTRRGLVYFLSSKAFKGIGRTIANSIVDIYGMDTLDIIRTTPELLLSVRGVTEKKMHVIVDSLKLTEDYNKLAVFLGQYGVSSDKIREISKRFGTNAVETIQSNPYLIANEKGIGFLTADSIARGMNVMLDSEQRIEGAINHILRQDSMKNQNLWTHISQLKPEVLSLLNDGFEQIPVSEQRYDEVYKALTEKNKVIYHGNCVFTRENDIAEYDTANGIFELMRTEIPKSKQKAYLKAFEDVSKKAKFPFGNDQRKAVEKALCNRVCLLTGGAGTGKTTVVKAIVDSYKMVNKDANVVLLAPTGKAARRLAESTGLETSTIHKACHIYDSYFTGDYVSLPTGLIVVDETSMVDQATARVLINAIRDKKHSHLLLVGDPNQLPSVGAGEVFKELIDSEVVPLARLIETHRQSSDAFMIVENANKVNEMNDDLKYNSRFQLFEAYSDDQAWELVRKSYFELTEQYGKDNVQILTPLRRKKRMASEMLNRELQNIINPKTSGSISCVINGTEFRMYDKVIQVKNTENASNGDVGVITGIHVAQNDGGDEMLFTIEFEGGTTVRYERDEMLNVELAYALTVHKSQGSQYKAVIMPLLRSQMCPLFTKEILYTSITRASECFCLISDTDTLSRTIHTCNRNDGSKRHTLLKERLKTYR